MTTIEFTDLAAFRRAIQEKGFAQAATTISSISGGHDSPDVQFSVLIDGVKLKAAVGYIHPLPFAHDFIGATVLIGVFHRQDYNSDASKLPLSLLPDAYDLDAPVVFTVRITDDKAINSSGAWDYRAYSVEVVDSTLRNI